MQGVDLRICEQNFRARLSLCFALPLKGEIRQTVYLPIGAWAKIPAQVVIGTAEQQSTCEGRIRPEKIGVPRRAVDFLEAKTFNGVGRAAIGKAAQESWQRQSNPTRVGILAKGFPFHSVFSGRFCFPNEGRLRLPGQGRESCQQLRVLRRPPED